MSPHLRALADVRPAPYWLDAGTPPDPSPALVGDTRCDLAVVGGGYTGLWTALLAKERDPSVDVLVLEARTVGWAASGRNGGFCAATLTHGAANGRARYPDEFATLERLGRENLDAIELTLQHYGVDCGWERTGELTVATRPWEARELAGLAQAGSERADAPLLLDRDAVRAEVDSPTYLAGLWDRDGIALVDPARLAWGLRGACLSLGVRFAEHTAVTGMREDGPSMVLATPYGRVRAGRVALATNAFPPLLRRLRAHVVPVYDYVLVTEPLSAELRAALRWHHRQGVADAGNQFHYYRLTPDDRILWGGYDAVYHFGNAVRDELTQRPETFATLARHFFATFPQLEGLRFTHAWGGVIDTSSRFFAFYGTAHRGRVAYALGHTGLGVGASRFAGRVVLDLLGGLPTPLTALRAVRERPRPFPPEPLRAAGIALTRWSLARADRDGGRRNAWLRALDRVGMGFDS